MSTVLDSLKKINWSTVAVVVAPIPLIIGALFLWWYVGFSWTPIVLLIFMYYYTGFGVTVGLHRLFTHDSFVPKPWLRLIIAVGGAWAIEGPIKHWVRIHRWHHKHSDAEDDPHSPHNGLGYVKGFYHSHLGWMFIKTDQLPDDSRVRALHEDWVVRLIDDYYGYWVVLGILFPAIVGGLIMQSWTGALLCFVVATAFRVFYVHHITWSINSICHLHGSQPFETGDHSRNNIWVGILSGGIGENWHNAHHAFQTSARHGLRWWEIDLSYYLIWLFEKLGWATQVRTIPQAVIDKKRKVKPDNLAA